MKRTLPVLLSMLTIFPCSAALALIPYPCGWYLDGSVADSQVSGRDYPTVPDVDNQYSTGWNLGIGYKFMPYLGVDLSYTSYADTRLENSSDVTVAHDRHYSVNLDAKGILPIKKTGFELFAKLGVARVNSEIGNVDETTAADDDIVLNTNNEWTYGLFVGVGVDYALAQEVQVDLQWNRAYGNHNTGTQFNAFMLGVTILFQTLTG